QTVHQHGGNTSDAAKAHRPFKAILGFSVTMDSSCENPEDGTKHQDASWQSKFADYFQIIAVSVVDQKGKKSGLHGSIRNDKSTQARTKQRMLVNQCKRVAPNGNTVLPVVGVFLSKGLESADCGIASHPKNHSTNAENKQQRDRCATALR